MLEELRKKMEDALLAMRDELAQIRTGRAAPSLVADLEVEVYNSKMTVKELAQITAPEPTVIVIAPWDKSIITNISGGIAKTKLGLNPVVDSDVIRINIPALTAERREQFIKQMNGILENFRVEIRHIRHEYIEAVREQEKKKDIGEDEKHRLEVEIQKIHDEFIEKVDAAGRAKEEQLREV